MIGPIDLTVTDADGTTDRYRIGTIEVTVGDLARVLAAPYSKVNSAITRGAEFLSDGRRPGTGNRRTLHPIDAVVLAMVFDTDDCTTAREWLAAQIHAAHANGGRPEVIRAPIGARTLVTYQPRWGLLDRFTTEDPR